METAAKILIVGGILNLAYGFLTGVFLAGARKKAPTASKYLILAHTGPLMQGPMLLEFVERPPGFFLGGVSAALSVSGLAILIVGVFRGL